MQNLKIALFIISLLTGSLFVPAFAAAQTASTTETTTTTAPDTAAQVQALLAQIRALQEQLKTILASSTPKWKTDNATWPMGSSTVPWVGGPNNMHPCMNIERTLTVGSRGEDVREIQKHLIEKGLLMGTTTGFYGVMTQKAMREYQERLGVASSSTGIVGPATRMFFKRGCSGKNEGDERGRGLGGKIKDILASTTERIKLERRPCVASTTVGSIVPCRGDDDGPHGNEGWDGRGPGGPGRN